MNLKYKANFSAEKANLWRERGADSGVASEYG
jgi:hypothetical protein